ncbi:MAG TPA: hypothetical protein VJ063_15340 [Verrucomicrobiae bacterium]|nr:hypothetical protein [Verrucomicrobiae bacterium]
MRAVAVSLLFMAPLLGHAAGWKLIGITGQQGSDDVTGLPDHTLFDLDLYFTDPGFGYPVQMFKVTFVTDSQAIGYCPTNDLLYHTAGSESWNNNPLRTGSDQGGPTIYGVGFQDNQYMESIDLATREFRGIFNAGPCPNPDPTLPCFGLDAPRPAWIRPVERRDHTQTGSQYRERGPDEFHAIRGLAWSPSKNAFFAADEDGIFKITTDGDSRFVSRPGFPADGAQDAAKGILVIPERLLIGHRNAPYIMEVDAETGRVLRTVQLAFPPGGGPPLASFGGVLGFAQHPVSGVIYAVRQTENAFARELVSVDVRTGETVLIGDLTLHIASIAFVPTGNPEHPWKLVGITGQQGDDDANAYPDHTLFDLDLYFTDPGFGYPVRMFQMTFVNDSQSIGYCPADGFLYHTGGAESWNNNPLRTGSDQGGPTIYGIGYQDSQYLEKVDLATQVATAIYNADPCPNPDPSLPCFGLAAPRPNWVLPVERRDHTQTGSQYRARGVNEYHAVRGMAWSSGKNAFYVSDENGIFRITRDGDCKFVSRPGFPNDGALDESKAILVIPERLLIGHRDGVAHVGYMIEVDAETGQLARSIRLDYPAGGGAPLDGFGGLLGLTQNPETGVVYGLRKTDDNFGRELVSINTDTGATELIGSLDLHIASIAFTKLPPLKIRSISRTGNTVRITWAGGNPPYQLEHSSDLTSWTPVGAPTDQLSSTQPIGAGPEYFRVSGQ